MANLVTADLMVLPSNLQCALDGSLLPFFSPYPVPGSSGVNLFAKRPYNHAHFFQTPMFCPPLFSFPRSLVLLKVNPFLVPLASLTFELKNSCGLFCNHIRLPYSLPGVPPEWFFPSLLKDFLRVGSSLGIFGCFVLFPFRIFMNRIY